MIKEKGPKRWPPGAHVLVRGHMNIGSTARILHKKVWVEDPEEWAYEVRFDDWRIPNRIYRQSELERINIGSNMGWLA